MSEVKDLKPGEARCPDHPSTKELVSRDCTGAPAPILEESYEFISDADIPFERYISEDFAKKENDYMWSRVWQWACHVDHIPEIGDYYVYDVGDLSAIIVRSEKNEIKAYFNSCLHRGTQLKPSGTSGICKELRCPFHGWTWSLSGKLEYLPCDWDFPHVKKEEYNLPELKCDLWGGFVFVNFDQNAKPLNDYLGVLPEHFKNWNLEDRYIETHVVKRLPANWKASAEAFLEAYHVLETHSEGVMTAGDANADYDIFGDHITRFVHTIGYTSPHVTENRPDEQGILDILLGRRLNDDSGDVKVPEGSTAREVYAKIVQEEMSEKYKSDFSHLSVTETIDSIEYFVFPNAFFFPGLQLPMVYRFRPDGVDHAIFDLLFLRPKVPGKDHPHPPEPHYLDINDSYTLCEGTGFLGAVYDQDTNNLLSQTKGFKTSPKGAQTLGNYQESRARHLHLMVDKYLKEKNT